MNKTLRSIAAAAAAVLSAALAPSAAAETPASATKPPLVAFRDDGRYLPPTGQRSVALRSVNVPRIHAEIRSVPPENIVQMLALEENAYDNIWKRSWGPKEAFVEDIAGEAAEFEIATGHEIDADETSFMPVKPPADEPANGVFLLCVRRADRERNDSGWGELDGVYDCHDELKNPNRYRVVCVTDLGLSVRKTASGLTVWVTSLAKGVPVADAKVEVFSSANVLVAKGVTDACGLARTESVEPGEPFAVVVSAADGGDRTFLALRSSMSVNESTDLGARDDYLSEGECTAFVWTERGIYRHDERIFIHALVRNDKGAAPDRIPVEIALMSPTGKKEHSKTVFTDAFGAIMDDSFSVPAERPSGVWRMVVKTPGEKGVVLGEKRVKIEEFAPPQIRVRVEPDAEDADPRDFAFTVSAEHLFGGPAALLSCEGAIVFQDAPFKPEGWEGWSFGGEGNGLKPNFRRLQDATLDADGRHSFHAPLWADAGRPRAAVRATAQGTVIENGGCPATARTTRLLHYYGRYIGTTLTPIVHLPEGGGAKVRISLVGADGARAAEAATLTAKLERIDCVYAYRRRSDGWATWDCDRVRKTVADAIPVEVPADGEAVLELPCSRCGDYALTVRGEEGDAPFAMEFYLSDWEDDEVRAPLSNPTAVTIAADKDFYRPGDVPRLVVKSPFSGTALIGVYRDDLIYTEVVTLTNATSEIVLRPVDGSWVPSVDFKMSVIQSVEGNSRRMAVRAHGETTLSVRRAEDELSVSVSAAVKIKEKATVDVEVSAVGAGGPGAVAVVTLVDEGINLLTDEPEPDPIARLSRLRRGEHPLYDIYSRILPVIGEDELRVGGVKTGGGEGAEMLGRVSPVPSRRFRPLAMWNASVPLDGEGRGRATFTLPEFVGEVRVSAVAYDARATGAATVREKVAPKLVVQPDAPRFVAPGDRFDVTIPMYNRSGADARVMYIVDHSGEKGPSGYVDIADGGSSVVRVGLVAPSEPGEMGITFRVRGCNEVHTTEILLPVRPAVAWHETSGFFELLPCETVDEPQTPCFRYTIHDSPVAKLKDALEWLADYPHGCLEQTTSRILPLVMAGDVLKGLGSVAASNREDYVAAGVARVESMVRERDFVMWPDCNYAPWDREVSLYAAHFLVEAQRSGVKLDHKAKGRVMSFLERWAMSETNSVSAYACHTLALAGRPEKDRMLGLYDRRGELDLLSRARLARAFAEIGDERRAKELLKSADSPSSVKEASFALLALLELDPDDGRIPALVAYLDSKRGSERYSWGTTGENAHALLALGAYWREKRPEPGRRYVSWRRLELPDVASVAAEASEIAIERRYLDCEGNEADLSALKCGEMLIVELTLTTDAAREFSDLVIEDLFAGAFEPVHSQIDPGMFPWVPEEGLDWVMRSDARDDRMLVFSKKFRLEAGGKATFRYPVRVVSSGEFILPGVAAEAMYQPSVRARTAPSRCIAAGI